MNFINNIEDTKEQLALNGYVVIKEVFNAKIIESSLLEIENITSSNSNLYRDKLGNPRRVEKIYNKGPHLKKINETILALLNSLFGFKWNIFKDKYNSKPPGGEGFYAHFDGIFIFKDKEGNERNGWHIYSDKFINALVPFDDFNSMNGPLEVAKEVKGTFSQLLQYTKKDGSPNLLSEFEKKNNFKSLKLNKGDLVFFSSNCPHRSRANRSSNDRRTLYYTYNPSSEGNNYEKYFIDKDLSRNSNSKSLSGEI